MRTITDAAAQERDLLLLEQAARREEAERAARRWQILAEASRVLASTLEPVAAMREVARLAVPEAAECCVVDLLDGAAFTRVAWAHTDPAIQAAIEPMGQFQVVVESDHPCAVACREGRPVVLVLDEAAIERVAVSPEHARVIRRLGARTALWVPLIARGRTLGVMTFVERAGRLEAGDARALAEELAGRVALALDNVRLYEQAQLAARRRDEVLGIVSHDLRNPLNVMVMILAALRRDSLPSPERLQKRLDAMERSADRMSQLIQDLVDVTRIEGSGLKLHLEPCRAGTIAEEACRAAEPLAASRSVQLAVEIAPGSAEATLDRRRILQVLSNLLRNAVQHTEAGGTVRLRLAHDEQALHFTVEDTGAGMAPEDVAGIFERFWQGRRNADGSIGLGLAIARGIVLAHGGTITLGSQPGAGTTVAFTLPRLPPEGGAEAR